MDISSAVTSDFVEHDVKTPVSKLRGSFDTEGVRVIVVTNGGRFAGVVEQKRLLSSRHPPEETAMNVAWTPPKVTRTENVREVARLMVESALRLLPVFEGERFDGVVTAEGVLEMVQENLDVLTVEDVYTRDLVAVEPASTLGEVIHLLRDNKITRVPVIEDGSSEGIISVYDLVEFTVREVEREQGGMPDGFDQHGGSGSHDGYRTHGGYGERAGSEARLLDLPARDVMSTPVETVTPDESLADAVGRMLDDDHSSLVVVDADGTTIGIVTKTDALRALTWTDEGQIPVQIFNADLLEAITREEIAARIEEIDAKYADMAIQEVNVIFHEHKERLRGTPLILATIRLFTDEGRFSGSAEEYGSEVAFRSASEVLEENVLEEKGRKTNTHTRKHTPEKREELERLLGWWLNEI